MPFPKNIIIAIIIGVLTSYIIYKIYNAKNRLFKYMTTINIIFIIFLLIVSLFSDFVNSLGPNLLLSLFILFYILIFVPFYIPVGYFILKKLLSFEWDSKGVRYFIAVTWAFSVIILSLIVLFLLGFYVFLYLFSGFSP